MLAACCDSYFEKSFIRTRGDKTGIVDHIEGWFTLFLLSWLSLTANIIHRQKCATTFSPKLALLPFCMFEPPIGCKELYEHTRLLPIPGAIDDYNHHMGGVDIADQLRAGFSTQQRGVKPRRPLFYWLLDTTVINAYCLFEHKRTSFSLH